jgi:class 3 adenylate cyclase
LGDAVNLASRIESFTRQAYLPLLVSEALVSEGTMGMSSLGDCRLRGLRDAIGLLSQLDHWTGCVEVEEK